ncbi:MULTISPECIES: RIP metalloprotease [unclassified Saccharopolyspora]|uniref:M50 family metallopeptidase n=1 Tax=unclassified Saccharopolyspora TaxID=2646250 RepID=UPI001CD37D84|nr:MULTISPECIES: site-2 protease family protein [unclassified Saccharopolyspora]MCA1187494.1 site-2 protease family protein [Saccharopolyspora sp. 6T]MCA1194723.1 site-2 protease family protein [Saccharopolyspora sp. 6V]MCA1225881.1 site-2 protease family protein [Saccharopolyspora sp. 6M]MCA1280589.1 site-2 protease family protein [Saccharopolyspora sp. 7B]
MLVIVGIVLFFVGLLLSIAWHELGHLLTAKMFGVKVTQYMVGFGRTVWSRKTAETEYGVKLIPFGGFIRMIGMFPPKRDEEYGRTASSAPWRVMIEDAREAAAEEVTPEDAHRQFYQRKPWKRIIVMAAGPIMNLILAVLIFAGILMGYGKAELTTSVSSISECVVSADAQDKGTCPPGAPPSPAAAAGFRPGDKIVEFDGKPYGSWTELQKAIRGSAGSVPIVVERGDQRLTLHADLIQDRRPALDDPKRTEVVGFLGLTPDQVMVRQDVGGVVRTIGGFVSLTAQKIVELPQRVPDLISAIGGSERSADSPVGIVGASRIGGEVLSMDQVSVGARLITMLNLLAAVNLSLFVMNMLPILPLDGGHIAGALWESVRRGFAKLVRRPDPGPFDTARLMPLAYGVTLVFIAYSLLVLVADVVNPVTLM